jgi:hypothetical protein
MKIKYLLFSLVFLISISCDFNESPKLIQESTLTKVLNDPLSKKISQALIKTQESSSLFIGNVSKFRSSKYKEFESIDDLKSFIYENYENPAYVYNSLFEIASIGQEIRNKYPEVSEFTTEDLEILVKDILEFRKNSNFLPNFRVQGQCEDEKSSSLQTCRDAALVGAAGCGLLTPTLLGALACGGIVYLGELVCIDDTNRSYEICKQNETIAP